MGVSQQQKDEWRDCLLQEVVSFLGARKDDIHRNYLARSEGQVPLTELEEAGLWMWVAITFLQDKRSASGWARAFWG